MNLTPTDLVDILKNRQIEGIQHYHAVYTEPWPLGLNEKVMRRGGRFYEMSRASPVGRKQSLFNYPCAPYHLDAGRAAGKSEGDAVFFGSKLLMTSRPGSPLCFTAQRDGTDVQSAVRPGEPIYIGKKVMKDMPERLGCRVVDITTSDVRYYIVLER